MNVLIDTSVWVDHFKHKNDNLISLLLLDQGLIHPMVLGELACGTPPEPRTQTLGDIALLKTARQATWDEVSEFIETHRLFGLGCGLVDISLLASTLLTPAPRLWTLDKRLAELAKRFKVDFVPTRIGR